MREVENETLFLLQVLSDHDMVSKTLPGDVFSPTITHMKIFQEFMIFFEILAFFQILLILRKSCTKNDLKIEQSVLPKMINFEQIIESIFQNLMFGRTDSFEDASVQSLFKSFFVHNLVRKIYVKMSKI